MTGAGRVLRALGRTLLHSLEGWIALMAGPVSVVFNFLEKHSAAGGQSTDATTAWSMLQRVSIAAGVVAAVRVMYRYQSRILELDGGAVLRASISRQPEHDRPTSFQFSLKVSNDGPRTAENVQVQLLSVEPRPRYGAFRGRYPQPIGLPINRGFATERAHNSPGRSINPRQTAAFDLAEAWLGGEDSQRYVHGIDGFDTRFDGTSRTVPTKLEDGEVVRLRINISAANAEPRDLVVIVTPNGNDLNMRMERKLDS